MRRALPVLFIFLSGCIVQSFYPFYTAKSKVAVPQLDGEWDAVIAFGDKMDATNIPPWQISTTDEIIAYDPTPRSAHIHVAFFKVGEQLFCDSIAGGIGDFGKVEVPWYWVWHARPVHTVTKIETNKDVLTFIPLDLEWLTNHIASGKVSLPHLIRPEDDNWPLFTAKSADWEKFLMKYANNADAFPTNHIYVLKRHLTAPAN